MKTKFLQLFFLLTTICFAQETKENSNPNFDPELAQKLGADDYGMKSYFLVILKTGPAKDLDEKTIGESFRTHLDNI